MIETVEISQRSEEVPVFRRETQVCIFLKNKPGRFAEVCDLLYAKGINIRALNVTPGPDYSVMRMVINNPSSAIVALEEERIPFLESEVLIAEVPNRPGVAAKVGRKLSDSGINIEYTYFSGGEPETSALMVFMVSDLDRALSTLAQSQLEF
jgi:hypothetical protein